MKEFIDKLIGRLEEYKYSHLVEHDVERLEHCKENEEECEGSDCFWCVWDKAIEIVNQLAEEYKGGWILCSERLPEEPFGCLVTVMDCEPMTQTDFENILPYQVGYDGETWNDADGNVIPFEVIAWQPLPAPYEKGE